MSEIWIPIIGMVSVTLIIVVNLILSAKHQKQVQTTLQKQLDNGGVLTPELLTKLGVDAGSRQRDMRRGIALVSLGLACFVAGLVVGLLKVGAVFGVFPLFLGLALLMSARIASNGR